MVLFCMCVCELLLVWFGRGSQWLISCSDVTNTTVHKSNSWSSYQQLALYIGGGARDARDALAFPLIAKLMVPSTQENQQFLADSHGLFVGQYTL